MENEAAIQFFSKLMNNFELNVYRFRLPDFPEADFGFRRTLGMEFREKGIPAQEDIAPGTIYVAKDMFAWHYVILRLPEDGEMLLAGPYIEEGLNDQAIMGLMEELRIAPSRFEDVRRFYHSVRILSGDLLMTPVLNTLGAALFGEQGFCVEKRTFRRETDFTPESEIRENTEDGEKKIALIEKRYEIEKKLLYAVEHGQVHQASTILSLIDPKQIDQRSANPLRNIKNYAIISNTLMRKAAQQGGVHPFYIDQLSSTLGHRIEEAASVEGVRRVMNSMTHKYCLLVRNHNMKGYSPPVQSVILRTDAEITGDLSLSAHAQKIGINASYLSALFKKETGLTLTDYVSRCRVEYAIFLLNSTDMQIQTIAQHCGMPDVNYFTRTFKKHTGKTPSEYRRSAAGYGREAQASMQKGGI